MEDSPELDERFTDMGSVDHISKTCRPTHDQYFLLYFIMGTYFAPDLKEEEPRKSVLQRRAECLPSYSCEQLAGSWIKTTEVENVYYHALRKADRSLIIAPPWLRQFFHGKLPTSSLGPARSFPQFDDLFPPHLHPIGMLKGKYEVINNIVFINCPDIIKIRLEHMQRFKRLTRLGDLCLDKDLVPQHSTVEGEVLNDVNVQDTVFHGELINNISEPGSPLMDVDVVNPGNSLHHIHERPINSVSHNAAQTEEIPSGSGNFDQGLILLPAFPSSEEWNNIATATKNGCVLTGSAAQIGPVIGLVDIGESEDSYLFRVSLPGVKRDERDFSCEVEEDGKVIIMGVAVTGEKTVSRFEETFEMQSQNLCPPGLFSITFKLPGPVDPQYFSGNFGTDGILEGIVMKAR